MHNKQLRALKLGWSYMFVSWNVLDPDFIAIQGSLWKFCYWWASSCDISRQVQASSLEIIFMQITFPSKVQTVNM